MKDPSGRSKEIRIASLNGYSLTVFSSLAIVERLIANGFAPGYWTPAMIMREDFILSLPGTTTLEKGEQRRQHHRGSDAAVSEIL